MQKFQVDDFLCSFDLLTDRGWVRVDPGSSYGSLSCAKLKLMTNRNETLEMGFVALKKRVGKTLEYCCRYVLFKLSLPKLQV